MGISSELSSTNTRKHMSGRVRRGHTTERWKTPASKGNTRMRKLKGILEKDSDLRLKEDVRKCVEVSFWVR